MWSNPELLNRKLLWASSTEHVHDVKAVPKTRKWRTKWDKYKVIMNTINSTQIVLLFKWIKIHLKVIIYLPSPNSRGKVTQVWNNMREMTNDDFFFGWTITLMLGSVVVYPNQSLMRVHFSLILPQSASNYVGRRLALGLEQSEYIGNVKGS